MSSILRVMCYLTIYPLYIIGRLMQLHIVKVLEEVHDAGEEENLRLE